MFPLATWAAALCEQRLCISWLLDMGVSSMCISSGYKWEMGQYKRVKWPPLSCTDISAPLKKPSEPLNVCSIVWSHPFQVEKEEGSGDTAIPNVCLALRSVRANQIARATCYFSSHVIVIWLLSQWRQEDNQIHSHSKNISELKATLAAHSWTRLQRHRSQRSSYLYECLNYSTFVLMIALAILEEQR